MPPGPDTTPTQTLTTLKQQTGPAAVVPHSLAAGRRAAMLRLRSSILTHLLSSPATSPVSPLHRLLSAAAPAISTPTTGFAVEDYLVGTCGLTRPQALKASAKLSHLKSPANADAVLAFLAGLGLSAAAVATAVARDPQLLCTGVERTLAPVVAGLSGLGVPRSEIARLVSVKASLFRRRSIVSNVALLQESGLGVCDIAKLCLTRPRLLSSNLERVQAALASAEALGVPRGSGMFRYAIEAVASFTEEKIAARVDYLKKTFRWSDADVSIAVCKAPYLIVKSKESLQCRSEFLISEVGLEPAYLTQRPAMVCYSLEGRMRPRYHVVKFLKENGLLKRDPSYYTVFKESEKYFMDKFICPHKEAAPHLAEDYAAACGGEVPARFRFT
ncbi:transcription termination factor MTERF9, chloroplastic-like [Triticum dicoccoides]|uniref:transcription termination factor MTERF9, chloroplastic-like n=1 Tax=Triticum dicoccoides TaxID=85692 RepID=UPI0018915CFC|nr:transcription termination factor MTERF9, chloroplastic-like [Triticum dicoccoides]